MKAENKFDLDSIALASIAMSTEKDAPRQEENKEVKKREFDLDSIALASIAKVTEKDAPKSQPSQLLPDQYQPQLYSSNQTGNEQLLKIFSSVTNLLDADDYNPKSLAANLKINPSKVLGKGSEGIVYQGLYRDKNVAIKIRNGAVSENASLETKILATIGSEISPLKAIYMQENKPCLVMEAFMEGDLHRWQGSNKNINESLLYRLAADIAEGVVFLHDNHILYRDFKSLNVLLYYRNTPNGEELRAQLCDFGLCISTEDSKSGTVVTPLVGTIPWHAPEILHDEKQSQYSKASDVFSLGMVLYEMVSGNFPYHELFKQPDTVTDHIKNNRRPWDITGWPQTCPQELRNLIIRCCDANPANRPSALDVHTKLKEELLKLSQKKNQDQPDVITTPIVQAQLKELKPDEKKGHSPKLFKMPIEILYGHKKALDRERKFADKIDILKNANFDSYPSGELKTSYRELAVMRQTLENKIEKYQEKYKQNSKKYSKSKYDPIIENYSHLIKSIDILHESMAKTFSSRQKPLLFQRPRGLQTENISPTHQLKNA